MENKTSSNYKWILLGLISATYFLAQGSRQIFNAVLPQIKADFSGAGISDAQLGLIGSAFTLVFGLAIPFGGVLADFFSRKWMIVVGTLLFSVGIFTSANFVQPAKASDMMALTPCGNSILASEVQPANALRRISANLDLSMHHHDNDCWKNTCLSFVQSRKIPKPRYLILPQPSVTLVSPVQPSKA